MTVQQKKAMSEYISSFVRVSSVRFVFLALCDAPQGVLAVLFIVAVEAPDGMYCQECEKSFIF